MKGLIIDTSSEQSLIGLIEGADPIHWDVHAHQNQLSKYLLPAIQTLPRPDYIAVGIGPGSFTGTRIGVAVAKSLCYAWDIPLLAFSSQLAHAPSSKETLPPLVYQRFLQGDFTPFGDLALTYSV